MAYTSKINGGSIVALFVVALLFLLFVSFAYSDTDRERPAREFDSRVEPPPPAPPPPSPSTPALSSPSDPAEPNAPRSPNALLSDVGSTQDPATPSSPSSPSDPTTPGADLGSQIKYCIVFPILNSAGPPIPTFDVPVCPIGPPPPGAARLTVMKIVINDDAGAATTTDFTLLVGSTTVSSGVQRTFVAGTYTVSEATTTVTVGTTTVKYIPEFSGDCDSAGRVTLAAGDVKTCTIINDDEGPGGQGGEGNGGGPSGGGPSGGSSGGGPSGGGPSGGSSGGGPSGGGLSGGTPLGQVAGAVTPTPEFMGGPEGEPGAPNAGAGGRADGVLGLLLFSLGATIVGSTFMRISQRRSFMK